MGPLHSLFYVLIGVVAWTLPWVAFHGLAARLAPESYTPAGTPTVTGLLALALALSLIAGFLTARLAHRRPMLHALALGLVQLALALTIQLEHWSAMPLAYHATFLALLVPGHVAGGRLGGRRRTVVKVPVPRGSPFG